jgi:hypothetical protein
VNVPGPITLARGWPHGGGEWQTAPSAPPHDKSRSGIDMQLCLRLLRAGATDDEIERELYKTSKKLEEKTTNAGTYVALTLANARAIHEAHAPRARVREARLEHLPERFGHAARTAINLELVTSDGEVITASLVVPSPAYPQAQETWNACLPDVDPAGLTAASWATVRLAWEAIIWKGRVFEVAASAGTVRWIRAATSPASETAGARRPRAAGGMR